MNLSAFLRGVGGEIEIGRVWLSLASFSGIVTPPAFETYEVGWNGGHFDVTAWCLAYPAGLAALVTAGIIVIGKKEKDVASAKQTIAETAQ